MRYLVLFLAFAPYFASAFRAVFLYNAKYCEKTYTLELHEDAEATSGSINGNLGAHAIKFQYDPKKDGHPYYVVDGKEYKAENKKCYAFPGSTTAAKWEYRS